MRTVVPKRRTIHAAIVAHVAQHAHVTAFSSGNCCIKNRPLSTSLTCPPFTSARRAWHGKLRATKSESLDEILGNVDTLLDGVRDEDHALPTPGGSSATAVSNELSWVSFDWSDWLTPEAVESAASQIPASPVVKVDVRGRPVYFKQDDLLRLPGSNCSGNKARKFFALNQLKEDDFPSCIVSYGGPQSNAMAAIAAVVHSKNNPCVARPAVDTEEIGDSTLDSEPETLEKALSLSNDDSATVVDSEDLISERDLVDEDKEGTYSETNRGEGHQRFRFIYYTKTLGRFLRRNPTGNLFRATALGMEIVELTNEAYDALFGTESGGKQLPPMDAPSPRSLWIPQGGASAMAVPGGRQLALEVAQFWKQQQDKSETNSGIKGLTIIVPGGTCTTALTLHYELNRLIENDADYKGLDIAVVVVPCVGNDTYAQKQMMALMHEVGTKDEVERFGVPHVLAAFPPGQEVKGQRPYFLFGAPKRAILETYREMRDKHGLELDLLYGAPSWNIILRHWDDHHETGTTTDSSSDSFDAENPFASDRSIMYIHSGGLEGLSSQLMRYKHNGLVASEEIQPVDAFGNQGAGQHLIGSS